MTISKDDVLDFFKGVGNGIKNFAIRIFYETLNRAGENAFSEGIEKGIVNTIAALNDANVSDEEIIRVVCKHWEITKQEAEDRLIFEKRQALKRKLKQYLKLQGYSEKEIRTFFINYRVSIKIQQNKEWLKLKNSPDKLFKAVQEQK